MRAEHYTQRKLKVVNKAEDMLVPTKSPATLQTLPPLQRGHKRLLLVRHGESVANKQRVLDNVVGSKNDTLTDVGRAQASDLGAALRGACLSPTSHPVFVVSSTLHRAMETADVISKQAFSLIARVQPSDDLVEINNGKLDGCCIDDVITDLEAVSSAWKSGRTDVRVGEIGDSPITLQDRAIRGLQKVFSALPEEASTILIVSHFWLNRTLLAMWMGRDLAEINDIQQPNAGISIIDVESADVKVGKVHIIGWQAPSSMFSDVRL